MTYAKRFVVHRVVRQSAGLSALWSRGTYEAGTMQITVAKGEQRVRIDVEMEDGVEVLRMQVYPEFQTL